MDLNLFRRTHSSRWVFTLPLLLQFAVASAAERVRWPSIRTDEEKIAFLLRIHDEMPELFPAMVDFNTNYIEVLEKQNRLNQELGANPVFRDQLANRPDRKSIEITVLPSEAKRAALTVESPELKPYGEKLRADLAKLPEGASLHDVLKEEIRKTLEIYPTANAKKFATNLIGGLKLDGLDDGKVIDRGELFKAAPEEKIRILREAMGSSIGSRFQNPARFEKDYLTVVPAGKMFDGDFAIQMLEQLVGRDEKLAGLYGLAVLSRDDAGRALGRAELEHRLANLTAKDALTLGNAGELQKRITAFLESTEGPAIPRAIAAEGVQQTKTHLERPLKAFGELAQQAEKDNKPLASYRLVEEPVEMAVVGGGCWGSDCNTKNLSAYNNSPHVSAYSIDREVGKGTRGRADTAIVYVGKEPYLYLNTVNGRRTDAATTEAVLRGFHAAYPQLGVKGIVLPLEHELDNNINFDPIRNVIKDKVRGKQIVNFTYPDTDLRRALKPYAASDLYHNPDKVVRGVIYQPEPATADTPQIKVEIKPVGAWEPGELKLHPEKVRQVAVELEGSGFGDLAQRFAKVGGLSPEQWRDLRADLRNESRLPVAEYLARAQHALEAVGVAWDPKFKSPKLEAFMPGLIRSPDAFSGDWKDRSVKGTIDLMKRGADRAGVAQALRENHGLFENHEQLRKFFANAVEFEGPTMEAPAYNAAEVLGDAGYEIDRMPEVRKMLNRALRSGDDYHVMGAASTLFRLRRFDGDKLMGMMLQTAIKYEGTWDLEEPTFMRNFQEIKRRSPAGYTRALEEALASKDLKLRVAALHAINITEVREPFLPPIKSDKILAVLKEARFNGKRMPARVRDYGGWLYDQMAILRPNAPATVPAVAPVATEAAQRRVAVIAAEVQGVFHTGGQGAAVLHYAQASNAEATASRISVVMPYYVHNDLGEAASRVVDLNRTIAVPVDYTPSGKPRAVETFSVHKVDVGNTEVFMLRHEPRAGQPNLFDNPRVEGQPKYYAQKNVMGKAWAAFDKAAAELVTQDRYDIASAADWHAGWSSMILEQQEREGRAVPKRITWMHNNLYKGEEYNTPAMYRYVGVSEPDFQHRQGAEYWNKRVSPLQGGINSTSLVIHVSPQNAAETATARFGYGIEHTMSEKVRNGQSTGILNGINNDHWTPTEYDVENLAPRAAIKQALQTGVGLPARDVPVYVSTARVTQQKGFDYSLDALHEHLLKHDSQAVVVGDVEPKYEAKIKEMATDPRLKDKFRWEPFSGAAERRAIFGGDSFFLFSETEPSGLNQQYALRAGAVPITTDVGGLKNTVVEGRNGFVAPIVLKKDGVTIDVVKTKQSVLDAFERYEHAYRHEPEKLAEYRRNGMREDNSWAKRIAEYEAAYDYVQESGHVEFKGHPISEKLAGLKPSELLKLSRTIRQQKQDCNDLLKELVNGARGIAGH